MPKVFKQKARTDIYRTGAMAESTKTKSGFRRNRSMPYDENDTVLIPRGSIYYQWSFPLGATVRQLTYPKRSQLTQSDFLATWYNMEDSVSSWDASTLEELESLSGSFAEECRTLGEEQQEKLENMPEQLQESPSGEILTNRSEGLEELANLLEEIEWETECSLEDFKDTSGEDFDTAVALELESKLEEVVNVIDQVSF